MVKQTAKSLGGKLVQAYYCLRRIRRRGYLGDSPTRPPRRPVLNASLGHIQITTLPAVNREEWKGLLQQSLGKRNRQVRRVPSLCSSASARPHMLLSARCRNSFHSSLRANGPAGIIARRNLVASDQLVWYACISASRREAPVFIHREKWVPTE
jgi:hypothetical protein